MSKQELNDDPGIVQPLRVFKAGLSMICPGLGQLKQGRYRTFFVHFTLFLVSLIFPVLMLQRLYFEAAMYRYGFFHLVRFGTFEVIITLISCVIALHVILFSILDVITWKPGEPSRLTKHFSYLAFSIVAFYVLTILLYPAVQGRIPSGWMRCQNNLRNITLALHLYHEVHGSFPPAFTIDENGTPLHSWRVLILPYIEEKELYEKIRLEEPWNSEHNRQFHEEKMKVFQCVPGINSDLLKKMYPHFNSNENCYYSVIIGEQTAFPGAQTVRMDDITDRYDRTILVVERMMPVCWMDPNHEISFDTALEGINRSFHGCGSVHNGIIFAGMADGFVEPIPDTIKPEHWKAALTIAGGEKMTLETKYLFSYHFTHSKPD